MKLATREEIREIDRKTIEEYKIPVLVLMENAGRVSSEIIRELYPGAESFAVIAGGGNNGGDGFVISRHLLQAGLKVTTYIATDPEKLTDAALTNFNILKNIDAEIVELKGKASKLSRADVMVDALFGTGLTRPLEGFYKELVERINDIESPDVAPKVAIDIPTGLDPDSGNTVGSETSKGTCINADATITFMLPNIGLFVEPGREMSGRVFIVDISSPKLLEDQVRDELITFESLREFYSVREPNTHKGTFGHLLILAGSPGKTGAAVLAARGAGRSGAGLITVGVPKSLNSVFEPEIIEPMTAPLPETLDGCLGTEAIDIALELLEQKKSALVIGPGISTTEETAEFLDRVVLASTVPVLIDADGLTIVSKNLGALKQMRSPCVLTPHPGEMARLTGLSNGEVQSARVSVSRDFARKHGVYLVLKGAATLVATPEGKVFVNPTGNPGMATAGMGDVLSGIIGGLLAQGYSPVEACTLGVFVHGLAADMYAAENGEAGLVAGDVVELLPRALAEVVSGGSDERFFSIR